MLLLSVAGLLTRMPVGYEAGAVTIAGGVLLGVGAFVNRTCAFGSIGRLGSGDLAFEGTLDGYFFGTIYIALRLASRPQVARQPKGTRQAGCNYYTCNGSIPAIRRMVRLRPRLSSSWRRNVH